MAKNYTNKNYPWSLKGLKKCIRDNKLKSEIICETDTAAIVHVTSYEDSIILGGDTKWCISQHDVSWKQYITDRKGIQLFIYCFDRENNKDDSLFGFTFDVKNGKVKPYCGFSRFDNPIAKVYSSKDDYAGLIRNVIEPIFGDIKDELENVVLELHEEMYQKAKEEVFEDKGWHVPEPTYTLRDYYDVSWDIL